MTHSDENRHQLTNTLRQADETIHHLTQLLEKSERRYRTIEHSFRWFAVALLGLGLIMIFYSGFNFVTNAQATSKLEEFIQKEGEKTKLIATQLSQKEMNTLMETLK